MHNENYDIFQNGKYFRLPNPDTDDYWTMLWELKQEKSKTATSIV